MKVSFKELVRAFMRDLSPVVKAVGLLIILTWAFYGYKQVEGMVHPVVTDFVIDEVKETDEGKHIAGSMNKRRDCHFEEVVAYSGRRLVDVDFDDVKHVVSRVEGSQAWGFWIVVPSVDKLTLYSRHTCLTGSVLTKLFDGEI